MSRELDLADMIQRALDGAPAEVEEITEPEVEVEPEVVVEYVQPDWSDHPDFPGVKYRDVSAAWLFNMPKLEPLVVRQYDGFEADTYPLNVPAIDPNYEANEEMLRSLILNSRTGMKGMYIGHTGCGKTSGIEYFAACTGRPFHRQEFDETLDDQKLYGSLELRGGETYHNPSDLVKSLAYPAVACLDEFSRATSTASMLTNPLLDRRSVRITSHDDTKSETITAHPEWMVVATDNTNGSGDNMDIYNAANVLDEAIRNRFDSFVEVPYLSETQERKLIANLIPDMDTDNVRKFAKFSQLCHKGFEDRKLTTAFSVRNLLAISKYMSEGLDFSSALKVNFTNRVSVDERQYVNELVASIWEK